MRLLACALPWLLQVPCAIGATGAGGHGEPPLAEEPWNTGWAFYIDNDAFALVSRDQQYTGGFALTLSGRRAAEYTISLQPVLDAIDRTTGFDGLGKGSAHLQRHALHVGVAAFTPKDIAAREPIPDDRPYASLVLLSNTQQTANLADHVVYQSSFVLGLLGTDVAESMQNAIHKSDGFQPARGWDHQISDGGEPTALYVASRYETIAFHVEPGGGDYQLQTSLGASLGFATQIGVGISGRWGRIDTPWWTFVPDYAEYASLGTPVSGRTQGGGLHGNDLFVWGGLGVRYRLYNALLEGQFRHSDVTYGRDQLHSLLAELSVGVTAGVGGGRYLSFLLRARTPELEDAPNALPLWGSIVLMQLY